MSFYSSKGDTLRPKDIVPQSLEFSIFTEEEIRKLCVVKIVNPISFDSMGHPLPGGLYDRNLGPWSEKGELCGTCNKTFLNCPGHFGFIDLPLPIVNPIFNKIIYVVLRMSCLSCFHIQIPTHIKHSISVQIKLLNCGLIKEALEVETLVLELIAQYESLEKVPENVTIPTKKYEDLVERALNDESNGFKCLNKTVENLRNQFVNGMLKEFKPREKCMYCKKHMDKISRLKGRLILSVNKLKENTLKSERVKAFESQFLTPEKSKEYMRSIWQNERDLIQQIVPILTKAKTEFPTDIFYFKTLPVTPVNLRPANFLGGRIIENEQSSLYKSILQNTMLLNVTIQVVQDGGDVKNLKAEAKAVYSFAMGSTPVEKLNYVWEALQNNINEIVDNNDKRSEVGGEGLKQIIEKKEGVLRQNMMGKRVNYAARSVIAPDPNLNIDEVGVPEIFAKTLTYPVPVTSWNVEELRKMILNGPNVHPGAIMVQYEDGKVIRINPKNQTQQESILKRLLTPDDPNKPFRGVKIVYRHLCNGDILLVNRQPTLHKPSIMAHTARILKGEKTIRLHYANCKAYNADFDGDEMNLHFTQSELGRSEGYTLANVCNQYLVPKDGTPLSGLIQDHMVSGVRLSIRGKFFTKNDYQQLVFQALGYKTSRIILLPPSIIKPKTLWSGKQILSTVIINVIPKGKKAINLTATSKISSKAWENGPKRKKWKYGGTPFKYQNCMSEAEVIIRNGELLVGVLDKTHYGATPYGLVHCIYELYGGVYATRLLSAFAKLFTSFLQLEGFTLGVSDILLTKKADEERSKVIEYLRTLGKKTITSALDLSEETLLKDVVAKIEEESKANPKLRQNIDRQYKSVLDPVTNNINKICLPEGLLHKFPDNNLQLMVQSGAKGSTVNTMQISCLLGQIELEGKRPPIMISGKSLPSFPSFEFAPRAGGFIDGRFMTGIQPQEFFFHCMAGREGLIDTAVKTSRSGYLQRCLIKHLEGLKIEYDMTVRDSDRSVIQFLYGEDGLDITKAQFLNQKQFPFLLENYKAIIDKDTVKKLSKETDILKIEEHINKKKIWEEIHGNSLHKRRQSPFSAFSEAVKDKIDIKHPNKIKKKNGRERKTKYVVSLWRSAEKNLKEKFISETERPLDPINSIFQPDVHFGALNERLFDLLNKYEIKKKKHKKDFENMLKLKYMSSLCVPGEPVGLLAAQSIGEPSTQMTLNTFHFAGRGEMNVTLGIPRLREILMMASKNIKTPSMEIPFLDVPNLDLKAEKLRKSLMKVVVSDVLEKIEVTRTFNLSPIRQHTYVLKFHFLPYEFYKSDYPIKPKFILRHMTSKFFSQMFMAVRKAGKVQTKHIYMVEQKQNQLKKSEESDVEEESKPKQKNVENDEESNSSDEEPEDLEDAKQTTKYKQVHDEREPEEDEVMASDEEENLDESTMQGKKPENNENETEVEKDSIQDTVVNSYHLAQNYKYDKRNNLWCELTFALPLSFNKIDLTAILKEVASKSIIRETPGIKRAITYKKDDRLYLRTDGINIVEMFKHNELLDLNKLYSNDIHKISETYGIEAASRVIVKEVQDVFKVYGITVDPRHLLLISDYMTYGGKFEPLNRKGMEDSASPFQQMSFEASIGFLKEAILQGKEDCLRNPSSSLMIGKPCSVGTGSFSLRQKLITT